jgi:flagellar protein FlgJ
MLNSADLSGKLAIDANGLNNLKQAAKENSPEAIKGVAKQFEAIFMNMMLKSMREASSSQDNPFDNEQSRTFTSMLDQQLSSNLASKGLGLADILAKQLSKSGYPANNALEQAATDAPSNTNDSLPSSSALVSNPLSSRSTSTFEPHIEKTTAPSNANALNLNAVSDNSSEFQNRMMQHAEEASRTTGVPAHLMLGQAALESGWGKRELKGVDGTPSYNLFGIKATGDWDGKIVEATTTEYIHGVKQKRIEKFRAYDSYADSFKDFANMMRNNQRYEKVLTNLQNIDGYAQSMQKAGYATDPNYASKLASVIRKITPS